MSATDKAVTTVVDLTKLQGDKLPTKGKVARGDTHANPLNMLDFIWRCQMLKQKPGGRTLDEVYDDLQRLYYASENAEDHQKPEFVERFKVLLDELDWEANAEQILLWIGDTLSDRGKNDALCIAVYYKLLEIKAKYNILLSNHDIEFLSCYYSYSDIISKPQRRSKVNLENTPDAATQYVGDGRHWSPDFEQAFIKKLILLDYKLVGEGDETKIILFSHAPVGVEAIEGLLNYFCLTDEHARLTSAQAIAKAIDAINTAFQQTDLKQIIDDYKLQFSRGDGPHVAPLEYICWNRSRQYLKDSEFVAKYVHGHCSHNEYRPPWFNEKSLNLNSDAGSVDTNNAEIKSRDTSFYTDRLLVAVSATSEEKEEEKEESDSSCGDSVGFGDDPGLSYLEAVTVLSGTTEKLTSFILSMEEGVNQKIIGSTLLHYACTNGSFSVFQALLRHTGIDVNATNGIMQTPIMLAVSEGTTQKTNALLMDPGVDLDAVDNNGWSVLHCALNAGAISMAHKLVGKSPKLLNDISKPNAKTGETVLGNAVLDGNVDTINWILEYDSNFQQTEAAQSRSALKIALDIGNIALALTLIKGGLLSLGMESKESLLRYAVRFHHTEIVKYLIEELQQDPTSSEVGELPVIAIAAKYGYADIFDLLLGEYRKKHELVPFTVFTEPALQFHTRQNDMFMRRCMGVVGVPPDAELENFLKKFIQKPFYHAKTMKILCESGYVNYEGTLPNGLTLLQTAIFHDDIELCKVLTSEDQGVEVTLADALYAVEKGSSNTFQLIFEKFKESSGFEVDSGSVSTVDTATVSVASSTDSEGDSFNEGLDAIYRAILRCGQAEILKILREIPGADKLPDDIELQKNLFLLALKEGHSPTIKKLFYGHITRPVVMQRLRGKNHLALLAKQGLEDEFAFCMTTLPDLDLECKSYVLSAIRNRQPKMAFWLLGKAIANKEVLDDDLCQQICQAAVDTQQFGLLATLMETIDTYRSSVGFTHGAAAGAGSAPYPEVSSCSRRYYSREKITKAAYLALACRDSEGFEALLNEDLDFEYKFERTGKKNCMFSETLLEYAISNMQFIATAKLLEKNIRQINKLLAVPLGKLIEDHDKINTYVSDVGLWLDVFSLANNLLDKDCSCFTQKQKSSLKALMKLVIKPELPHPLSSTLMLKLFSRSEWCFGLDGLSSLDGLEELEGLNQEVEL